MSNPYPIDLFILLRLILYPISSIFVVVDVKIAINNSKFGKGMDI